MAAKLAAIVGLFALLHLSSAGDYKCQGNEEVAGLTVGTSSAVFDHKDFAPNQLCTRSVRLSDTQYATLDVELSNMTAGDQFQILGVDVITATGADSGTFRGSYSLAGVSEIIRIKTGPATTMTVDLNVTLYEVKLDAPQVNPVKPTDQATVLSLKSLEAGKAYTFTANENAHVTLAAISPETEEEELSLLGFFIYEDGKFKMSLNQTIDHPYVSSTKSVTVYAGHAMTSMESLLLAGDYGDLAVEFSWGYTLDKTSEKKSDKQFHLSSSGNPAYLVVALPADDAYAKLYLTNVSFPSNGGGQLSVYSGTYPTPATHLAVYNQQTVAQALPQLLHCQFKTFLLAGGQVSLTLSPTAQQRFLRPDLTGFLMTPNYPFTTEETFFRTTDSLSLQWDSSMTSYRFESIAVETKTDAGTRYSITNYNNNGAETREDFLSKGISEEAWMFTVSLNKVTNTTGGLLHYVIKDVTQTCPTTPENNVTLSSDHDYAITFPVATVCSYEYHVPPDFIAHFHLVTSNFGARDSIRIIVDNSVFWSSGPENEILDRIVFGEKMSLDVYAPVTSANTASLRIKLIPDERNQDVRKHNITAGSPALILDQINNFGSLETTVITAPSQVYIGAAVYSDAAAARHASNLLLFDGAVYKGTLYDVQATGYLSTNTTVTIYNAMNETLDEHHVDNPTRFIFLDYESDVKGYGDGSAALLTATSSGNQSLSFSLDARTGPAVLCLLELPGRRMDLRLNSISFSSNTAEQTLTVSSTTPIFTSSAYNLITYKANGSDLGHLLPQDLPTSIRTFTLNTGTASFSLSAQSGSSLALWKETAVAGRHVTLMTPNYQNPMVNAASYYVDFAADQQGTVFQFDVKIDKADPSCVVSYTSDSSSSWSVVNTTSTKAVSISATSLEIQINPGNNQSTGAMLTVDITRISPVITSSTSVLPVNTSVTTASPKTTVTTLPPVTTVTTEHTNPTGGTTPPPVPDACTNKDIQLSPEKPYSYKFEEDVNCNRIYSVPANYFAYFDLHASGFGAKESLKLSSDSTAPAAVFQTANGTLELDQVIYGTKFSLNIVVEATTKNTVSLVITLIPDNRGKNVKNYTVAAKSPALILDQINNFGSLETTVVTAPSMVYIGAAVYSDAAAARHASNLLLFDGAVYKGTLYDVQATGYLSTNTTVTIYNAMNETLDEHHVDNPTRFLFLDYVSDVVGYATGGAEFMPVTANQSSDWTYKLDASKGPTVLTLLELHQSHLVVQLKSIDFQAGTKQTLTVSSTTPIFNSSVYTLFTYDSSGSSVTDLRSVLPQSLPTSIRTFTLNTGTASFSLSSQAASPATPAWKQTAVANRKVTLMTANYQNPMADAPNYDAVFDKDKNGTTFQFVVTVVKADPSCVVSYTSDSSSSWSVVNKAIIQNSTSIISSSLNITIAPGNSQSTGAMLIVGISEYTYKGVDSATACFLVLLLSLLL